MLATYEYLSSPKIKRNVAISIFTLVTCIEIALYFTKGTLEMMIFLIGSHIFALPAAFVAYAKKKNLFLAMFMIILVFVSTIYHFYDDDPVTRDGKWLVWIF